MDTVWKNRGRFLMICEIINRDFLTEWELSFLKSCETRYKEKDVITQMQMNKLEEIFKEEQWRPRMVWGAMKKVETKIRPKLLKRKKSSTLNPLDGKSFLQAKPIPS